MASPRTTDLVARVRGKLNDTAGLRYKSDPEIQSALNDQLRDLALLDNLPAKYLLFMGKESDEIEIPDTSIIDLPGDCLRLTGGHIGTYDVVGILSADENLPVHDPILNPTTQYAVLKVIGNKVKVLPPGRFTTTKSGEKLVLEYIVDPPPLEQTPPELTSAVVFGAAHSLAGPKGDYAVASWCDSEYTKALMALGILESPKEAAK